MTAPSVTVVVCTAPGREAPLRRALAGLRRQRFGPFGVVVVTSGFGADDARPALPVDVYAVDVPETNLSAARNAGIRAAPGELVCFIDDDAVPETDWLAALAAAFVDPEIAAAGGPVLDHTGLALQTRYSLANSLGDARIHLTGPNPSLLRASPGSDWILYPIGTNVAFRRVHLVEIGGFDEEFDYYLDEADICRRLTDRGWVCRALDDGYVLHGFLASGVRSDDRVLTDRYSILKNRCYFALRHGAAWHPFDEVMADLRVFADHHRADCRSHIASGALDDGALVRLEQQIAAGYSAGRAASARGPRLRAPAWFGDGGGRAVPRFETCLMDDALHVVLLAPEWPPARLNGIARVIVNLACGLADRGHVVRVLTPGRDGAALEYEDGIWVQRVPPRPEASAIDGAPPVPDHIAAQSLAYRDALAQIHDRASVDLVQLPNWDSPGIAILAGGGHRTVLGLYTPLRLLVATDARIPSNDRVIGDLEQLERVSLRTATAILACGEPIVEEVERSYGVAVRDRPLGLVPHGIEDVGRFPASATQALDVLFVGRLEPRKGVAELLIAARAVLGRVPTARFLLAGEATGADETGSTYPATWARDAPVDLRHRLEFLGPVDDDRLLDLYTEAAVVVVPSRFESFGLTVLEAMRAGTPVVATATGEMQHIVTDARCGIVVPTADAGALATALEDLLVDGERRAQLGAAGRESFMTRYTRERMAAAVERFYRAVVADHGRGTGVVDASAPATTASVDLRPLICCPDCRGQLDVVAGVTADDLPYEGFARCAACGVDAAAVRSGRFDFHRRGGNGTVAVRPVALPRLGERRIDAAAASSNGDWRQHGDLREADRAGARLVVEATVADAWVLLLRHPHSGVVELVRDGEVVDRIDLYEPGGSVLLPYRFGPPGPPRRARLEVRVTGDSDPRAAGSQVLVREFVLTGPLKPAEGFRPRVALQRGNPYSTVIARHLEQAGSGAWILECGGGERRRGVPRHVNFEYLPFESADVLGDGHALPFHDDSFDLVISQAVIEHLYDPFRAVAEMIRVARPGGLLVAEAAFMQPLHAVPSHYFNVTPWGMTELFRDMEPVESGWFGSLSGTVEWLMAAAGLPQRLPPETLEPVRAAFRSFDASISHDDLRAVASGVYTVVRKPAVIRGIG